MITKNKPRKKVNKGDTVYYEMNGLVYGPYTVKFLNKTAVMDMVSFKEINIAVGICYIKHDPDEELGKMTDYLNNQDSYLIKNVYEEGINFNNRSLTQMEGIRNAAGNIDLMFFRPDNEMIKWLVKYAKGRLIIDVGCGSGRVTTYLADAGATIVGVDPFLDIDNAMAINMNRIQHRKGGVIHFLDKEIDKCTELFKGRGNKILLMFARPCHSNYVFNCLKIKDKTTEALYITVPDNLKKYNDLGSYEGNKKQLIPKGISADNEIFFSIR